MDAAADGRREARLGPGRGIAELRPDPLDAGAVELLVDGIEQSHVDPAHPDRLFYDYVRRIGTVLDLVAPPGDPLAVLHLGAGALTLVRYVEATRPGSEQHVVELEPRLVPFVLEHLPLAVGTRVTVHTGDAAAVLARADATAGTDPAADAVAATTGSRVPGLPGRFDVVVSDLYRGTTTPPHLLTAGFFAAVARRLGPDGILIVNVADDDGLPVLGAVREVVRAVLPHGLVTGPAAVLQDARDGNAVVVASRSPLPAGWAGALAAAGPHPVAVRDL